MSQASRLFIIFIIALLLLAACSSSVNTAVNVQPAETATPLPTAIDPTSTPTLIPTPEPTSTPVPTPTIGPLSEELLKYLAGREITEYRKLNDNFSVAFSGDEVVLVDFGEGWVIAVQNGTASYFFSGNEVFRLNEDGSVQQMATVPKAKGLVVTESGAVVAKDKNGYPLKFIDGNKKAYATEALLAASIKVNEGYHLYIHESAPVKAASANVGSKAFATVTFNTFFQYVRLAGIGGFDTNSLEAFIKSVNAMYERGEVPTIPLPVTVVDTSEGNGFENAPAHGEEVLIRLPRPLLDASGQITGFEEGTRIDYISVDIYSALAYGLQMWIKSCPECPGNGLLVETSSINDGEADRLLIVERRTKDLWFKYEENGRLDHSLLVLVEDFRMMVMIFERNQLLLEVSDPGFAGVPSNSDNLDYSDFDLNVITVTSIELVKDD